MGSDENFLIAILHGNSLSWHALSMDKDSLPSEVACHPNKQESRDFLHALLPLHVRNMGGIVDVKKISGVHTA